MNQISKASGISLNHFYLSTFHSNEFQFVFPPQNRRSLKVFYTNKKSQKYNGKGKISQIANFVRDHVKNPPLYDWNLKFPHQTQRQNVIIVYSDLQTIDSIKDLVYERSDKFSFSKIEFSVLNSSYHFLSLNDLPAMIFPDIKNSTCSILKNIDTMLNLRVAFDNNRFGKSNYPFSSYYKITSFSLLIIGVIILIVIIIIITIKNSKPEKTE